ncbi:MAG: Calx-beta domain [Rhodobacteraceae bacterium HLUCCO07]|nr:MAG: Calx-beta domain [Rhodobacteraceae bacterium HLUCCO07]
MTVDYRTVQGTAETGSDFTGLDGTLTFEAGETTKWINVQTLRDDIDETDEALELILSDPSGAVLAGGASELAAVGWILDDDGAPEDRAIYAPDVSVPEGDSGTAPAVFDLRLSRPSETDVDVTYNTADLTARAGDDYTESSGTLTFAPGQTSATAFVPVIGNTEDEPSSREFLLNFAPDTSQVFSGTGFSATGTILDDDVPNASPTGSVEIVGDAIEGETLTADTSTLEDANGLGTLSFQWLRDDTPISGATSSSYEATTADVGNTLQLRVSYTDGDGYSESVTSEATEPVAGPDVDITLSGRVSDLQGDAMDGVTLSLQAEGLPDQTATSDASGAFDFTLAEGTGGRLEATRPLEPATEREITTDDALDVLRLAVNLDPGFGPATPQNYIAADIDGDARVTAGDALEILRTAIGLDGDHAPRWVFLDAETDWDSVVQDDGSIAYEEGIEFAPLSGAVDLAMTGILVGNMEAT